MLSGDDTTAWNDAGPCPACGDTDCWLGCPDAQIDEDRTNDVDDLLCGCDYCNLVGQPCWRARAANRDLHATTKPIELSPKGEAALLELLGQPAQPGHEQ